MLGISRSAYRKLNWTEKMLMSHDGASHNYDRGHPSRNPRQPTPGEGWPGGRKTSTRPKCNKLALRLPQKSRRIKRAKLQKPK